MKQLISVLASSALVMGMLVSCAGRDDGSDRDVDSTKFGTTEKDRTYNANSDSTVATGPARAESKFINETAEANYAEISLARLASDKSTNTEVKQIAKMLVDDHTAALNKLQQIAGSMSVNFPANETEEARKDVANLSEKTGENFDKDWVKEMIKRHEKSIKNLEDMQDDTTDPQLKAWIDETLPKVKMHEQKLEECKDKMK